MGAPGLAGPRRLTPRGGGPSRIDASRIRGEVLFFSVRPGVLPSVLLLLISASAIAGDFVIDGQSVVIANEERNIQGNLIIRNGGRLELNHATIHLVLSYDEEFDVQLQGNATLIASDSRLDAIGGQTGVETTTVAGLSPSLSFTRTTVTNHAGIRARGAAVVNSVDSPIEEIQVHDAAQVTISGGNIYPVLFYEGINGNLSGLRPGPDVSFDFRGSSGWRMAATHSAVSGFQLDLDGNAQVVVSDSAGIVVSIHTPGNLAGERLVSLPTMGAPVTGTLSQLGPALAYTNVEIDLLNVYLRGHDSVRIENTQVNEANLFDDSRLSLSNCTMNYNLYQTYDRSTLLIQGGRTKADSGTPPSLTAQGRSTVTILA